MRILAVDTATEVCGVALLIDGQIAVEQIISQGLTHTRTLMMSIQSLLIEAGLDLAEVDGLAVSRGPGSFTGLRIGISTVKGIATATGKPIVGISTLAALAHQAPVTTRLICPMIDARRGEVYWSLYERADVGLVSLNAEQVGKIDQVLPKLKEPCLLIGNGAQRYATEIKAKASDKVAFAEDGLNTLRAGTLATLALPQFESELLDDPSLFGPIYIRPSDAQPSGKMVYEG
ncbi:MAG: tRNA (adenosine(37)-N6)-threonylcarbamoyltransferase complex dimerization subunit type 1 TsaB [Desulfobacteraceae bacterium]|nr:tRNA (adenosine(37)-N6)-threonylcarbamoyltransferase complex dimerization subunit type 1 TsaB [Desulfobacteraceae bacterium]